MDKQKVVEWLKEADGYCIMAPKFFQDMGLDFHETTHSSDPELGKHAATRSDGEPGDIEGVSEFVAIRLVCKELGVPSTSFLMGRGSTFDLLKGRVLVALKK